MINDLYLLCIFFIGALIIDWRQTLTIAKNPDKWYELNPILGRHPSVQKVHIYFLCVLALLGLAVSLVPTKIMVIIMLVATIIEVLVIYRNDNKNISV